MLTVSAAALRQHIIDGETYAAIAHRYGSSEGAVTQRCRRLGVSARQVLGYHRAGRPKGRRRMCVVCESEFSSTGAGNVVCKPCKQIHAGENWTSGVTPI
ncbi:hypothetical protein [Pelagibacterium sp.]|uniref:hypothetical protein n=1 Tax=Pelagibacterium sp. TaxID=1967288 RepID=UPI003A8CFE77